ncbi:MAG: hypothetical protein K0R65_48 [Crocinitomicaceae bacterium]|jgi:glycosyltransferase involved in cell wall biosynthesis|nr:hypothetical protein [Crocinitomicaceae bacterium]
MKILIIDNSIGVTGAIKAVLDTIEGLGPEFSFVFAIPKGGSLKAMIEEKGYSCIEMNFVEISRRPLGNLAYPFVLLANAFRISRLVRREKINIIQVNDIYNLSALVARLFVKVKVLTHIRRMPESFPLKLYSLWVKLHSRFSTKILPVSKANARIFGKLEKIEVFYDPAMSDRREAAFKHKQSVEPLEILYLANYTRGKGQEHALGALKILLSEGLNVPFRLRFVGGDFGWQVNKDFREELQQIAKADGLEQYVVFDGPSDTIFEEIKKADIMLNFSESESLSRVTMEALYYRIPLIATDVGGTNEMIEDGFNGFLVEKGNVQQMAEKIKQLMLSPEKRFYFYRNNENLIASKFSQEKIREQLKTIYKSIS